MIRRVVSLVGVCLLLLLSQVYKGFAEDTLVFIDVVGASGDGDKALAAALSERLLSQGVAIASTPTPNAFEIQGIVKVGQAKKGRQPVRIDWTVLGPDGDQLGNVIQEQEVRQGSLDRHWGGAAEAAAAAAAKDILKLIPAGALQ